VSGGRRDVPVAQSPSPASKLSTRPASPPAED
jgi:hypothetical protein